MAIDERAEQPAKPPEALTTRLDQAEITRQLLDKVLLKLTEVGDSQTETTKSVGVIGSKVDALGSKVDTMSGDVHTIKAEQVEIREWKGAVEERFKTHSMGTKALSISDGNQDAKMQELENRLAVAAESSMRAILAEMATAAKTPMGRKILTAGGYMLLALFGAGTVYFGAMTSRLQQQPPTIIQVAPAAALTDGGTR